MGINVLNSIQPQQFIWLVRVVTDTQTGGKIIEMAATTQRSINANVTIDKVLQGSSNLTRQSVATGTLNRSLTK